MKRVKVITIAFAFMLVLVAATAQPVAAASRSDSLRSYISGRYDEVRGGYSPPSDNVVRVDATYGAILALNELGSLTVRPPPVNLTKVLDSLIMRQWETDRQGNETGIDYERYGGFSEYLVGPVTMNMDMMGTILLHLLKMKNQADYPGITAIDIDKDALLVHLNRAYRADGAFSAIPGRNPEIVSTYQALFIIDFLNTYDVTLNAWDIVNETATIEWINSCRSGDGFKLSPESDIIGVTATAAGIMALELLPSISTVPGLQAATNWVLARQIDDYVDEDFIGGFEEGVATGDPNFVTTYYALKMLESSGDLVSANQTTLKDFILNCQVEDGSWGYLPGAEVGSLVYAGQACELLNMIGNAANILASSEDPYSPGGFILDWRYVVVAGIILVALVIAVVSVRMD